MKKALLDQFQETLHSYYVDYGRHDMPWRQPDENYVFDPYKIMVSEIMLQQTQVSRVAIKYKEFLKLFPTVESLAVAPLATVLGVWSGLGYNRRAKFLWQAAQMIVHENAGIFPANTEGLIKLPGIGPNTAGAILAYAYNKPVIFIETNIRTVFIHHFFHDETNIPDASILGLVAATLDSNNAREFYWSLMDYGAFLKQTIGNLSRASKGYKKQSKFDGSLRQIRGLVLRLLMEKPLTYAELKKQIEDTRLSAVLTSLAHEELIRLDNTMYYLG